MSDDTNTTPDQPVITSDQQDVGTKAPKGYVELARYTPLVQKVEQLTLANRELTAQLAAKSSELEQLKTQLGVKESDLSFAVKERDNKIRELNEALLSLKGEASLLRSYKAKVEAVKSADMPDLIEIIDTLPDLEDAEALQTVVNSMATFGKKLVQKREEQLLAGITPPTIPMAKVDSTPTSTEGWQSYLDQLLVGSPEYDEGMKHWKEFERSRT